MVVAVVIAVACGAGLALLSACGSGPSLPDATGGDGGGDDGGQDEVDAAFGQPDAAPAAPTSGTYLESITETADTCNVASGANSTVSVAVESTSIEFYYALNDFTLPCSRSGASFECGYTTMLDYQPTYDATVTRTYADSGAWISATRYQAAGTLTITCVGSDCSAVAALASTSFPCSQVTERIGNRQ